MSNRMPSEHAPVAGAEKVPLASKENAMVPAEEDVPLPRAGRQITLQVGERQFITTRQTLVGESDFFASLLSERWDNAQTDGSYFIDADAKLFQHILRYLRRGVFPIFYDKVKGHDYAMYVALLHEAKYFQIANLMNWLETKRYLNAVKVMRWAEEIEQTQDIAVMTYSADTEVKYYPALDKEKVYICPRRIPVHRGKPQACGNDCRRAQGDDDDEYKEEPVFRTLVVREETIFDARVCLAE